MREAFALLGICAGLALVVAGTGILRSVITAVSPARADVARAIAAASLMGIALLVGAIVGHRVAAASRIPGPRLLDCAGGSAFAFVRALVAVALALFCLAIVWGPGSEGRKMITDSTSGDLLAAGDSLFGGFYSSLVERSGELHALERWASRPDDDVGYRTTEFEATDATLSLRPEAEREMLDLINRERTENGLPSLEWCSRCAEVARSHSRDMYRNGFFAHEDLSGNGPFDRMQSARIEYAAAGENLALAPRVVDAHEGLMRSADHRANILRSVFDEVGIGIYEGPYGLMCTQVFRAVP